MKLGILLLAAALPAAAQTGRISGIVTNGRAAEAGVWVIAETDDLPTKFAKIVVTDEQGRYVIPELPKASYRVWVRGYGLVDSPKVQAAPGKTARPQRGDRAERRLRRRSTTRRSTGTRCSASRTRASFRHARQEHAPASQRSG